MGKSPGPVGPVDAQRPSPRLQPCLATIRNLLPALPPDPKSDRRLYPAQSRAQCVLLDRRTGQEMQGKRRRYC
jgi:hypothetical protein